jgi:hypothetical protein
VKNLTWNDIHPLSCADPYRHELTEDQCANRIRTALHEAGHIVIGHHLRAPCSHAIVRVPGKTPRTNLSARGVEGRAMVIANDPRGNAMVSLAGFLVEFSLCEYENEDECSEVMKRAANDIAEFDGYCREYKLPDETEDETFLDTLVIVENKWRAIDGAAAFLLSQCDSTGVCKRKRMVELSTLLSDAGWQARKVMYSYFAERDR